MAIDWRVTGAGEGLAERAGASLPVKQKFISFGKFFWKNDSTFLLLLFALSGCWLSIKDFIKKETAVLTYKSLNSLYP